MDSENLAKLAIIIMKLDHLALDVAAPAALAECLIREGIDNARS